MITQPTGQVPLFAMDRKIAHYRSGIDEAIHEVIDRSSFILGSKVSEFESKFANYLGVGATISVANGTDALEIAIRCLNLPSGSLIATVANAGNYSSTAIFAAGHFPLYVDIDPATLLTTFDQIRSSIQMGAKAVVLTHLYGNPVAETIEIAKFCKLNGVYLIEDCAQAHGAKVEGILVGTFGDVAAFSFYPTKNLGALGDAGAVVTSNSELARKAASLRNYGWDTKYSIKYLGGRNSRMDELQASILIYFLENLDSENELRKQFSKHLRAGFTNKEIDLIEVNDGCVYHLFVVKTRFREQLSNYLNYSGIQTGIHYPILDMNQIGRESSLVSENLIHSVSSLEEILTLPMHPYLAQHEIDLIIRSVNNFIPIH